MTPPTTAPAQRVRSAAAHPATAPRKRAAAPARSRKAAMPRGARRVSGPAAGLAGLRGPGTPSFAGGVGSAALPLGIPAYTPLGLRIARRAAGLQDARFLDRLIRGRLWIGLIGAMLIGLVFLQVSLLSLNTGIGQDMQKAAVLERQNSALQTQISEMDAGQRVQDVAAQQGLVMPAAGSVRYRTAGAVSATVAARGIASPSDAAKARVADTATPAATPAPTPAATTAATPAATTPAATTAAATPAATHVAATTQQAPATQQTGPTGGVSPPAAGAATGAATPQG
ncbi:hypothetical protein NBH00_17625 [Paraconexibacter antarcticus]|uniref:Cell division protein FtsL n=1 Tax=Paraconexibacter antarcticus TaxID=2949664 RepID=A0ABY5DMF4_9ACTN|nr:hypothetical protein [Paraconexibacter antarcticus]UTI63173.1 hypothetical protein NBH00_17625 [Paraconexibacter antarcticus]